MPKSPTEMLWKPSLQPPRTQCKIINPARCFTNRKGGKGWLLCRFLLSKELKMSKYAEHLLKKKELSKFQRQALKSLAMSMPTILRVQCKIPRILFFRTLILMETPSPKDPISNLPVSSQQQISSTTCKLLAKSPQLNQSDPYIASWLQLSYTEILCTIPPAHVPHCRSAPRLCSPYCPSITHALWWKLHPLELGCGELTLSFLRALLQLTSNHKNLTKAFRLFCVLISMSTIKFWIPKHCCNTNKYENTTVCLMKKRQENGQLCLLTFPSPKSHTYVFIFKDAKIEARYLLRTSGGKKTLRLFFFFGVSQFTKQKYFMQTSSQLNSFGKQVSFHWSYASPGFWAAQLDASCGPGLLAPTVSTNLARQTAWRLRTLGLIMPAAQGRLPGIARCHGDWRAQRYQGHG